MEVVVSSVYHVSSPLRNEVHDSDSIDLGWALVDLVS